MAEKNKNKSRLFGGFLVGAICLFVAFSNSYIQCLFMVLVSLLTLWEFSKFIPQLSQLHQIGFLVSVVGIILPFIPAIPQLALLVGCCAVLIIFTLRLIATTIHYTTTRLLVVAFIYPCLALGLFASTLLVNNLSYALLLYFLMIWASDVGAYYTGRAFGRKKLMPKISPGKTVAGFLGAGVSVILVCVIFNTYFQYFTLAHAILLGITIWLFSSFGDLFQSSLKRYAGIKDSGNIIPGHGGIFDRFDGFIFAAPFYSLYLTLL